MPGSPTLANTSHTAPGKVSPTTHSMTGSDPAPRAAQIAVGVQAWGVAQVALNEIPSLRKSLPDWAPEDTSGHFFKYSDEQTIAAVQAIDAIIRRQGGRPDEGENWGVVTAPKFLGRLSGAALLVKFAKSGAPGVSPHIIPQSSLHSVSGALSILLGTCAPNVGVGGGPGAFFDGLLTAATLFDANQAPGVWFVATEWDPEPIPDREARCTNEPVCYAAAFALRPLAANSTPGKLELRLAGTRDLHQDAESVSDIRLAELVRTIEDNQGSARALWRWHLPWGDEVQLSLSAPLAAGERAAQK